MERFYKPRKAEYWGSPPETRGESWHGNAMVFCQCPGWESNPQTPRFWKNKLLFEMTRSDT